ncbi:hypothetical protein BGP77_16100 [Saccharospirillum sp. MSK14-1]|uniref:hypothetical protein n=1 Tax=Saccharospirillum sp. MSK14-1 TaxID=1897632 RepID=UPI000D365768|nr:hypothetical protein [Saccharospirillum sp. MSK14-1]PTY37982.1 hypothetical protein BGP77_16100 [Saccharospirillum sp. MSK14-1]
MKFPQMAWASLALTALILTGCDSSSDGSGGRVSTTINDPNWSAGADNWASIAIPDFDNKASIFALVRNDSSNVQRLLSGQRGDRTFTSTQLTTSDTYNDIAAVRITQSQDGETRTDYAIAACVEDGSVALFLASDPNKVRTPTPTDATRCASIAVDPINYSDGKGVKYRIAYDTTSPHIANISFNVDLFSTSAYMIGTPSFSTGESVGASDYSIRAIEGYFYDDYTAVPVYAMQSSTNNYIEGKRATAGYTSAYYNNSPNPFTGATENFDLTDLVLVPDQGLYMVSEVQGLVGNSINSSGVIVYNTQKLRGDGDRCIDALAWDGEKLWCHDATSEGRLISFTPPDEFEVGGAG